MGLYRRKDSPYWWMHIVRVEGPPIRESTRILHKRNTPYQTADCKVMAEHLFQARMAELAKADIAAISRRSHESGIEEVRSPLKKSPEGWCYVYFIECGETVKIGKALDVSRRMKSLQTGQSSPHKLLAAIPTHAAFEQALHVRFKHLHQRGEWFRMAPDLRRFIVTLQSGTNPIALLW